MHSYGPDAHFTARVLCNPISRILHFGKPPRYRADVSFIHIEIQPEELHQNVHAAAALCGHAAAVVAQLHDALGGFAFPLAGSPWFAKLSAKVAANKAGVAQLMADDDTSTGGMSYYRAFKDVAAVCPRDAYIVSEGANTMDIGRGLLDNALPRRRIDAATYGTMGVGLGQAIAACAVAPNVKVVCVEGDSAIGFSIGELETMCRYKMPVLVVVINNSGIGIGLPVSGDTHEERREGSNVPPTSLSVRARYDLVMEAFGGAGFLVREPAELRAALEAAAAVESRPALVNVLVSPFAGRKKQSHDWLSRQSNSKL